MFQRNGTTWSGQRRLSPQGGFQTDANQGQVVAISASTIIASAPGEQMTAGAKQGAAYVYELTLPPNAPSNVNAVLNVTGKGKNTAYNGFITWADNSNNESGFLVQRYVKMGNKCLFEATLAVVPANQSSVNDPGASAKTCGYGVAATNAAGTSTFVTDFTL